MKNLDKKTWNMTQAANRILLGIGVIVFVALVIIPVLGAGTGDAKRVFPENDTAGFVAVDVLSIDPSIKDSTPDYSFLILSPEGKENQLNDVNHAIDFLYPGGLQNEIKAELTRKMSEIWDKYPVVLETKPGGPGYPTCGGNTITVRFASSTQGIRLTNEENNVMEKKCIVDERSIVPEKPAELVGNSQWHACFTRNPAALFSSRRRFCSAT